MEKLPLCLIFLASLMSCMGGSGESSGMKSPNPFSCSYTILSDQFDMEIEVTRWKTEWAGDSASITILIHEKNQTEPSDTIQLASEFMLPSDFSECGNVRSFSSGVNAHKPVLDYHSGDLVVADLNFDGKDDLAVITNSGGNGGPAYGFFIQGTDCKFVYDSFLSDSVVRFPRRILYQEEKIVIRYRVDVANEMERVFQLRELPNSWELVNQMYIGRDAEKWNAGQQIQISSTENMTPRFQQELNREFAYPILYNLGDTIFSDLNGDTTHEQVVFTRSGNSAGITITDGSTGQRIPVSWGINPENQSLDFGWIDYWGLVKDDSTYEILVNEGEITGQRTIPLSHPAIVVRRSESGGGLIVFREGTYRWVHQSD